MDLWCNCCVFSYKVVTAECHSSRMEYANAVLSVRGHLNNVSSPIPLLVLPLKNNICPQSEWN